MNSNERRLKILYMLQSGKRITSRSLMEQFGISKRTVYRDLNVVQELGVPLTHHPETGYGVLRDGLIPPIMFTFRELAVIMVGLSFVTSQIDEEMVKDAENVLLKIRSAVPSSLQSMMNILEDKTLVSPYIHNVDSRHRGGDWFILSSAFVENRSVTFTYRDRYGTETVRKIDPQLLIHYTDHWNVIGYCHDRLALRNFMLSRMSDIKLTDSPFLHSGEHTKEELLYGRSADNFRVTVEVRNEKLFSFLTELPGKITKKVSKSDSIEVSFSIDNLEYINEWLLRFGSHVKIKRPVALKKMHRSLLESLLDY